MTTDQATWAADPTGRHQLRWWDGAQWTDRVSDEGELADDPIDEAVDGTPPPPSLPVPPTTAGSGLPLPEGVVLSSKPKRLANIVLEYALVIVTFVIGWLIWSLIVWQNGQTPAKQLLGMRVYRVETMQIPSYPRMFARFVIKSVLWLFPLLFVISGAVIFFGSRNQTVWDLAVDTVVVDDNRRD